MVLLSLESALNLFGVVVDLSLHLSGLFVSRLRAVLIRKNLDFYLSTSLRCVIWVRHIQIRVIGGVTGVAVRLALVNFVSVLRVAHIRALVEAQIESRQSVFFNEGNALLILAKQVARCVVLIILDSVFVCGWSEYHCFVFIRSLQGHVDLAKQILVGAWHFAEVIEFEALRAHCSASKKCYAH